MPITKEGRSVLVIRFNSIGDIVLTTPVVECLASNGYRVHYVAKNAFKELLDNDPHVEKVWPLQENLNDLISRIKEFKYDLVVDLHNNVRSKRISQALGVKTFRLDKERIGLFLLTQLGIGKQTRTHIVDRFMEVIRPLSLQSGTYTPRVHLPQNEMKTADLPSRYIAVAVGTAWKTKSIPVSHLKNIIESLDPIPIVLLGGPDDVSKSNEIDTNGSHIHNRVGQLSITESAEAIKSAQVLLTGDTGMMHIAAALDVPVVAVYGSTHPMLGYTPFYAGETEHSIIQNEDLSCRPCTKQGKDACPKGHFKCMMDLNTQVIIDELRSYVD